MGNNHGRKLSQTDQAKLDEGKPVYLDGGIRITKNKSTGEYQGVPVEWAKEYDLPIKVNYEKTIKTKHFSEEIRPEYDLPESIINLINSQDYDVDFSAPTNFSHQMHLEIDLNNPFGIKGLPNEWIEKFNKSNLSAEDIKSDPKSVMRMISGYDQEIKQSLVERTLLTTEQFQKIVEDISFLQKNPASKFKFEKQLGKGAMCKVFYACDRSQENRRDYACRIIKLKNEKTLQKIKTQIAVMNLCKSDNIVNYYFTYYFKDSLFMFIQFMDGGALTDFIYHYLKKVPEDVIAYIMKEILTGLEALHDKRQLHRDLKSDNILINSQGEVKIADFGFAIQLTKDRLNRKSVVGTPAWMAPQLVKKEDYNEKVDIWSAGMIAIELCNGQPPYLRLPHLKAMHHIVSKAPPVLNGFSQGLTHFVSCCLQKDPEDRLSSKQLLEHNFLKHAKTGENKFKQMYNDYKSVLPF